MAVEAFGLGCCGKIGEVLLVECVVAPIKRQFNYMCCFNSNIAELENQFKELETTRQGVQMGVDDDHRKLRRIGPPVEAWLTRANEATTEVEEIIQDKEKVKEGCLNGWCPNLKLRYSLSREAVKKTKVVVELKNAGAQHTRSSFSPHPACLETITTDRDFMGFESRKLKMEEIIKALKHDGNGINLIGISGMGGTGKTTMAKEVAKRVKEDGLFAEVAWAEVGKDVNLTKVQKCVAEMLGLRDFGSKEDIERAHLLRQRLLQDNKKILVILDDVWEEFNLEDQGFPFEGTNKHFKMLYTSRSRDLWLGRRTKVEIPLELLSEDEAWQLFTEKAVDSTDAGELQPLAKQISERLRLIAKEIVNECGRLPLALVLNGSALLKKSRGNDPEVVWQGMLDRLTRASSTLTDRGLYSRLELSYEYLENEDDKRLFLLCCLFGEDEDIRIEDLARYGWGLSFFGGMNDMGEIRRRVYLTVVDLKSRNLLLDGGNQREECVKVHDVVRDMGNYIASKNKFALVRHGRVCRRWPEMDTVDPFTAISVVSDEIEELAEGLTYPNLKFLMLRCPKLKKLPPIFFEGMRKLKVLELREFGGVLTLQSSRNLTTLSLEGFCGTLDKVSLKGSLPNLEILNLRDSKIKELPEEIGELVNLRVLDLRDTSSLTRIPSGVISRLVHLEQLYFFRSNYTWPNVSCKWEGMEEGRNADLRELELLSNLNTLEILVDDIEVIPEVPIFCKLKQYKVVIRRDPMNDAMWEIEDNAEADFFKKCKRFLMVESSVLIPRNRGGIGSLLRSGDCVFLEGEGCNDLVQALLLRDGVDGLQQLKYLIIGRCHTPECLANTMNQVHLPAVFPILKALHLRELDKLREICRGPVAAHSFGELTYIHVEGCNRLKNLFEQPIVGCLTQLKHLIIRHCDLMEQVILKDNQEDIHVATNSSILFPKLEVLELKELPSLVGFCSDVDRIDFPQLKILCLDNIPKVNFLFHNDDSLSSNSERNDNVELFSLFPQEVSLPNLEVLRVLVLHNLERLGQVPTNSFLKLKQLEARDCRILRNLFQQDMDVPTNRSNVFLELEVLALRELPSLVGFCIGVNQIDFPQLKNLYLSNIPKVNFLFHKDGSLSSNLERNDNVKLFSLFPQEASLPNLEVLEVADLHLERLEHVPTNSFSKLKELKVIRCPSLRNMFLPSTGGGLVNLQILLINNCSTLEAVFGKEGVNWKDQQEDIHVATNRSNVLSKLEDLKLFKELKELRLIGIPHVNLFHNTDNWSSNSEPNNNASLLSNFPQKVSLPKLEILEVAEFPNLEHLPFSMGSLSKLKEFFVHDCGKLLSFFPSQFVLTLQEFQKLTIKSCNSLEVVFESEGSDSNEQNPEILPPLKSVELCYLPKLNYISKRDPASFKSIQTLNIHNCKSLRYVFAPTMTKSIPQLRLLIIQNCEMLSRIVAEENGFGESSVDEVIEFPQLERLTLSGLPNLVSFFPKVNTTTPAKSTNDYYSPLQPQPLFNEKVAIPNLTILELRKLEKVSNLWCGLEILTSSFSKLEKLIVINCSTLEAIVGKEEQVGGFTSVSKIDKPLFPQLMRLHLYGLTNLKRFCNFNHPLEIPLLSRVFTHGCPNMDAFSLGPVSAPNLSSLNNKPLSGDLNTALLLLQKGKKTEEEGEVVKDVDENEEDHEKGKKKEEEEVDKDVDENEEDHEKGKVEEKKEVVDKTVHEDEKDQEESRKKEKGKGKRPQFE